MIPKQAAEMIDYVGGATGKLPAQNLNLNLDAVDFQDEMRGNFKHIGVYPTVIRERYNITDQGTWVSNGMYHRLRGQVWRSRAHCMCVNFTL